MNITKNLHVLNNEISQINDNVCNETIKDPNSHKKIIRTKINNDIKYNVKRASHSQMMLETFAKCLNEIDICLVCDLCKGLGIYNVWLNILLNTSLQFKSMQLANNFDIFKQTSNFMNSKSEGDKIMAEFDEGIKGNKSESPVDELKRHLYANQIPMAQYFDYLFKPLIERHNKMCLILANVLMTEYHVTRLDYLPSILAFSEAQQSLSQLLLLLGESNATIINSHKNNALSGNGFYEEKGDKAHSKKYQYVRHGENLKTYDAMDTLKPKVNQPVNSSGYAGKGWLGYLANLLPHYSHATTVDSSKSTRILRDDDNIDNLIGPLPLKIRFERHLQDLKNKIFLYFYPCHPILEDVDQGRLIQKAKKVQKDCGALSLAFILNKAGLDRLLTLTPSKIITSQMAYSNVDKTELRLNQAKIYEKVRSFLTNPYSSSLEDFGSNGIESSYKILASFPQTMPEINDHQSLKKYMPGFVMLVDNLYSADKLFDDYCSKVDYICANKHNKRSDTISTCNSLSLNIPTEHEHIKPYSYSHHSLTRPETIHFTHHFKGPYNLSVRSKNTKIDSFHNLSGNLSATTDNKRPNLFNLFTYFTPTTSSSLIPKITERDVLDDRLIPEGSTNFADSNDLDEKEAIYLTSANPQFDQTPYFEENIKPCQVNEANEELLKNDYSFITTDDKAFEVGNNLKLCSDLLETSRNDIIGELSRSKPFKTHYFYDKGLDVTYIVTNIESDLVFLLILMPGNFQNLEDSQTIENSYNDILDSSNSTKTNTTFNHQDLNLEASSSLCEKFNKINLIEDFINRLNVRMNPLSTIEKLFPS
ncbi:uncharacterized protein LOC135931362 [Gordionus sp. m RMFG-2023]|uniref:uncharacterized protein LOC135931362 n=1 Tax=Gordionus sp. m RMFG-2023 TaxID=3053472 RepID=UPI0031FCCB7D